MVTIATWNVNSIKARLPNVLAWLEGFGPDVVLLQEVKTVAEGFPYLEIEALGYNIAVVGQKTRLREVMLPVLLLPVLTPLLMAAVEGTAIILTPGPDVGLGHWMQLMIAFDIMFMTAGFLVYGLVLED